MVDPSLEQGRWLLLNGHFLVFGTIEDLFMRGHNAHRNLCVTTSDSALLNLLATASVSCHLDELGKTAHVNGNQT